MKRTPNSTLPKKRKTTSYGTITIGGFSYGLKGTKVYASTTEFRTEVLKKRFSKNYPAEMLSKDYVFPRKRFGLEYTEFKESLGLKSYPNV